MNAPFIWNGREADDYAKAKIRHAQLESDLATARLQGMKLRAKLDPPRAAEPGFPYPHRTCAEWRPLETWIARRNP